jgi:hypothetical protein
MIHRVKALTILKLIRFYRETNRRIQEIYGTTPEQLAREEYLETLKKFNLAFNHTDDQKRHPPKSSPDGKAL